MLTCCQYCTQGNELQLCCPPACPAGQAASLCCLQHIPFPPSLILKWKIEGRELNTSNCSRWLLHGILYFHCSSQVSSAYAFSLGSFLKLGLPDHTLAGTISGVLEETVCKRSLDKHPSQVDVYPFNRAQTSISATRPQSSRLILHEFCRGGGEGSFEKLFFLSQRKLLRQEGLHLMHSTVPWQGRSQEQKKKGMESPASPQPYSRNS